MSAPLSPEELDLLADLLAGEGTEEQVAAVAASPALAQALADLDAADALVRAGLASVASFDVSPPPGFDERLRAALAAEGVPGGREGAGASGASAGSPGYDSSEPVETVLPFSRRAAAADGSASSRSASDRSPWLLRAAAGVIAVGLLGGLGVLALRGGDGGDADQSAAPASAQSAPSVPTSSSGTDYSTAGSLQSALPALLAGAATLTSRSGAAGGGASDRLASSASSVPSGATSSAPSRTTPLSADSQAEGAVDGLARLRDPAQLQACYTALELPPGTTPEALDYARFAGKPALVIVLPVAARADKVEAFVVGASCGAGTDDLLFFGRLDAP